MTLVEQAQFVALLAATLMSGGKYTATQAVNEAYAVWQASEALVKTTPLAMPEEVH